MPTHRFSASASARARHCLYWARPDAPKPPYRQRRDATIGRAVHFALEHTVRSGDTETVFDESVKPADALNDSEREDVAATHTTWLAAWWQHHSHEGWLPEVAMGTDPVTRETRIITRKERRAYDELPDSFVPGTADMVRFDAETRVVHVIDAKTGGGHDLVQGSAARNDQLASLAVGFVDYYHAESAIVSLQKVRPSGVTVDTAELSMLDLSDHREWLRDTLERIPNAEPVSGPHCYALFCDHYGSCPATIGSVALVAPGADLAEKRRLPIVRNANEITGPDHARFQYETLRAAQAEIEAAMAEAWTAVREYADAHGGIELDNGMVWKRVMGARESIDLTVVGATNALEHALGPAWRNAVEMSTSKRAIESAVRPIAIERSQAGEKVSIAGMARGVVDALRSVGAVTKKETVRYEEVEQTR